MPSESSKGFKEMMKELRCDDSIAGDDDISIVKPSHTDLSDNINTLIGGDNHNLLEGTDNIQEGIIASLIDNGVTDFTLKVYDDKSVRVTIHEPKEEENKNAIK